MAVTLANRPTTGRRWPAVLAWTVAGLTVASLVPAFRFLSLAWSVGSPGAPPSIAAIAPVTLAVVSAAAVGALVASRRPSHPVGWLLLGVGLAVALSVLVEPNVKYGLVVRPGSLPAARQLVPLVYSTWFVGLSCAGFVLLLTPTGSLPSPRWRWWARVAAAAPVLVVLGFAVQPDPLAPDYFGNPLSVPALAPGLLVAALAGMVVVIAGLLVGAGSLVLRLRRARGSSACSCAGWPWPRPARRWCCWPAWPPRSWAGTRSCWRPWRSASPCSPWRPGRRSCATGCTTWTGSSAGPWPMGC
jgi:hypothetical protein